MRATLERIERRQRDLIFFAVIAYNAEAFPPQWIRRGLERLKRLKEKYESNNG